MFGSDPSTILAWIEARSKTWTNHLDLFPLISAEPRFTALFGFVVAALILWLLYAQCCTQPRKRDAAAYENAAMSRSPSSALPLSRTSSRDSIFSDFSPVQSRKHPPDSPHNSFHDLVELTKPALQHIGASLPVSTIQRAVSKLNDRLQYRFVTSKTHVGGGLSSIFIPEEHAPSIARSPSLAATLNAFDEDYFSGSEDEDSDADIQALMLTEQAFRRSEVFASLPDTIVKLLVKRCQLTTLKPGEVLFNAGDKKTTAASTYLVVSGEFTLTIPSAFFTPAGFAEPQRMVFGRLGDAECDDDNGEEEEETLTATSGKMITGISDFIATIVGEPVEYVATGTAKTSCVVAKVSHDQLEQLFDAHEGVREDLLQRYLGLLQRVTFSSVFRLTGRYASSFSTQSCGVKAGSNRALDLSNLNPETDWATIASVELGIAPADLIAFAKERRKRTTLRKVRTGSFFKGSETATDGESYSTSNASQASIHTSSDLGLSDFPLFCNLKDKELIRNEDVALYIVLSGLLEVRTLNFAGDKKGTLQFRAFPSHSVGQLKVLTRTYAEWYPARPNVDQDNDEAYPRNCIVAVGETKLLKISERDYFDLVERYPDIVVNIAKHTITQLNPLVRLIDVSTKFFQAQPGDAVVTEGELVDGLMVVLHGRVRYYQGQVGGREFGRGAVVGESSFLTNQPSMHSVVAMRRTSLACVPKMIMRSVAAMYPNSLAHIGRTISRKMLQGSFEKIGGATGSGDATKKRKAVAVVPVSPNVPFDSFIHALNAALNAQGIKSTVLSSGAGKRGDSSKLEFYGGTHSVDSPTATSWDEIEILSRIQDAEEANDVVLFQLDPWSFRDDASKWSKLCVAQADAIVLVANASDRPLPSPLEKRLRSVSSSARRELVMLHVMSDSEPPTFLPKNTREWIEELGGNVVTSHHVRFHPYDSRLDTFGWKSDLRRLGRWITGNAIGLVLGGGGARGSAHLSVLKAFEAFQIPVDFIGGTSIGAFVGGLYCMKGGNLSEVVRIFDQFATEMASMTNKIRDITFPIVSYMKGYQFNRSIVRVFGDTNIEDFWTNFFCVSTDLTDSREISHRNGAAWKYIRASMTLTGYLPPICDVQIENGKPIVHYLVDGGYIDNMPVDEMRKIVGRSGVVVAVDVQSEWKLSGEDYGEDLNGWWYLWRWLSPFHTTPAIPTASEIQSHLAFISCVQRFGRSMTEIPVDLYIAPPLGSTLTLEFNLAKKIQAETYGPVFEKVKGWLRDPKTKQRTFLSQAVSLASSAAVSSGIMASPTGSVDHHPRLSNLTNTSLKQE